MGSSRSIVLACVFLAGCPNAASRDVDPKRPPTHAVPDDAGSAATIDDAPSVGHDVRPSPAAVAAPQALGPDAPAPASWSQLQPLGIVRATRDATRVERIELSAEAAQRIDPDGMGVTMSLEDSRIPPELLALREPYVLTREGAVRLSAPTMVFFENLPMGAVWTLFFEAPSAPIEASVAMPVEPVAGVRLAQLPKRRSATKRQRRTIAAAAKEKYRPRPGQAVWLRELEAQLPAATAVWAAHWDDEEAGPAWSIVFTVDAAGEHVETLSPHRDYLTWADLTWVQDLDGDGVDEVGWGHGGIEDQSYFVTHWEGNTAHTEQLYAAGH